VNSKRFNRRNPLQDSGANQRQPTPTDSFSEDLAFVRSLTPEQFMKMEILVSTAQAMLAEGYSDNEIVRRLKTIGGEG
jgi:hypothetical protein